MDDQAGMDVLQFLQGTIVASQIDHPGIPGSQINGNRGKLIEQTRGTVRKQTSAGVVWRFAKLGSLCPICDIFVPQPGLKETHRDRWVVLKKPTKSMICCGLNGSGMILGIPAFGRGSGN
jgi:hypothetical protein